MTDRMTIPTANLELGAPGFCPTCPPYCYVAAAESMFPFINTEWAKNGATLHFLKYLENYQNYHDFCTRQGNFILNMSILCQIAHFIT